MGDDNALAVTKTTAFWIDKITRQLSEDYGAKNLVIWTALTTCSCDEMKYFHFGIHYRKKYHTNNIVTTHYVGK